MKKNILITGSTDGIGKLAAIKLAKDGHHIYLHGRNSEKLERVVEEVKYASKNENIKGFVADFSDLGAVKKMGQEIKDKISGLDVLINNAGVFKSSISKNGNGLDLRFVVNYFAPYLLTNEILPLFQKTENARIINLSSAAQAPISIPALKGETNLSMQESYAQSKLAILMWSFHLAKKLEDTSVIAVNPGSLLNTNMVREAYGRHWSSADKGADILYDLAVSDEHKGMSGRYFDNDREMYGMAHGNAYDDSKIENLIKETEAIIFPKD